VKISSRKEREKERKKDMILTAAEEVFRRHGYEGTTMEHVADEAEFSKGTLYLYFGSKFALFAELSNRVLQKVLGEFQSIAKEPLVGRDMIAKMLRLWADEASSNIRRFRLAISWMASDEHPDTDCPGICAHRETMGKIVGLLATAISRGQDDGSIAHTGHPPTLACQLWSGMVGCLLFSSRMEEMADDFPVPVQYEGFMNGYVELLSAGLASKG